jgi:hypothetical protein
MFEPRAKLLALPEEFKPSVQSLATIVIGTVGYLLLNELFVFGRDRWLHVWTPHHMDSIPHRIIAKCSGLQEAATAHGQTASPIAASDGVVDRRAAGREERRWHGASRIQRGADALTLANPTG